jgi:uncharacterized membrane protein YdjX (TVP38/TMEM64 family)
VTRVQLVLRLLGFAAVLGAAAAIAISVGFPSVGQLRASFAAAGWMGGIGFAASYAAISLSPLPKTVFTLAAGAIFGVAEAIPVVVGGAVAGAVCAFFIGRVLGRDVVRRLTGQRMERLDDLLERRGLWALLVARLVPLVPFTAINYAAGLTRLPLLTFVFATIIGILPATTAYVTVGAYGGQPGSWPFLAAIASLVLLTAAGLVAGWRRGRRDQAECGPGVMTTVGADECGSTPM